MTSQISPQTQSISAQSHQKGVIKEHWNDIPAGFAPTSRNVSRNASRTATPQPSKNGLPSPPTLDSDNSNETSFDELISTLLNLPTHAPPAEAKLCASRIQKALSTITPEQKAELCPVIKAVVVDRVENPAWGREQIIDLMTRERGIAGWASAIRRMVECVKLE